MRAKGRRIFARGTNINSFVLADALALGNALSTNSNGKRFSYPSGLTHKRKKQVMRELIAANNVVPRQSLVKSALPKPKSKYTVEEVDTSV